MSRRDIKHANLVRILQTVSSFCEHNNIPIIIHNDHIELDYGHDLLKVYPYDRHYCSLYGSGIVPFGIKEMRKWLESYLIPNLYT